MAYCPALAKGPAELARLDAESWRTRADDPLLHWAVTLGAAAARCADGGAIVACVEAPAPLDAAGWTPECGVADGVGALARSLAQSEGTRGVRVNTVVLSPRGAAPVDALVPGHPGRLDQEAAATVRWLLSPPPAAPPGARCRSDLRTRLVSAPRCVLITGASGGVGRGIALACGSAGWQVWIAARRTEEGRAVAREVDGVGGQGHFVACEVAEPESVAAALTRAAEHAGALHGVVHNATSALSGHPVRLADVPLADLRDHIAVSVRGSFHVARAALPHLRSTRGSLLLLTSEAGFEGKARLAPYAGVKAFQRGMTRALAREWGPEGVRVNAIAPLANSPPWRAPCGRTPRCRSASSRAIRWAASATPVDEIGAAARFLLSDDASYVTGHTLMADGGSCPAS